MGGCKNFIDRSLVVTCNFWAHPSISTYRYIDVPIYRHCWYKRSVDAKAQSFISTKLMALRILSNLRYTNAEMLIMYIVPIYRLFRTHVSTCLRRYIDISVPIYRHFRANISTFSCRYMFLLICGHIRISIGIFPHFRRSATNGLSCIGHSKWYEFTWEVKPYIRPS